MKNFFYLFLALIISQNAFSQFITVWKTDNSGTSNSTSLTIPTTGTGYNYDVDWNNDGTFEQLGVTGNVTHDYGTVGTYTVAIRGNFPRIYFNNTGDKSKILSVVKWGDIAWTSMNSAFYGCWNMVSNAIDNPNLSAVTDLSNMFNGTSFNQNIGVWNVSNITNMSGMFKLTPFNQNISAWNVANVTDMSFMFNENFVFNQNIVAWNVSNVTNMSYMFNEAILFNQNIGTWNVSHVTDMSYMFRAATSFNQNIGAWDVSHVTNMKSMFSGKYIITNYPTFNQDISAWNVSNVSDMSYMFYATSAFNQNINTWNVSNVTDMSFMFSYTTGFNQNIGAWNVANVTNMRNMFNVAKAFNQNISIWNVAKVTNMSNMFNGATAFNQNIGPWNITLATTMTDIFKNSAISSTNYDNILLAWNTAGYTNKNLGSALPLTYCVGQVARANMISNKGWTIAGDTYINTCPITSIASGNWAVSTTWNAARVPQTGDNVIIDSNHIITLDGVSNIKKLEYRGTTGKLIMSTTASRVNTGL